MSERHVVDAKIAYNLTVRVLCDIEPKEKPFIAYLFGQTKFNQDSVLNAAANLYKKLRGNIFISAMGGPPLFPPDGKFPMYEGFEVWSKELQFRMIPAANVFPVEPLPKPNSFTEAQGIVRLAKDRRWPSIYIVAPPFHLVRCFISVVTVALQEYPGLKVYNKVGETLNWNEEGIHSQGTLQGTRKDFIDSEWDRIEKYMNLISPKQALEFLENRD